LRICMSSSMRRRKGAMGRMIFMTGLLVGCEMISRARRCRAPWLQRSHCELGSVGWRERLRERRGCP